jgi:hypothetical protein
MSFGFGVGDFLAVYDKAHCPDLCSLKIDLQEFLRTNAKFLLVPPTQCGIPIVRLHSAQSEPK